MVKWLKWLRPSSKASSRKQTLFTSNVPNDNDDFYQQGGFIVPPQNAPRISTSSDDLYHTYKPNPIDDAPKSTGSSLFPKFLTPKLAAQWRTADSNQLPKQYQPRNPSTDSSNIPFYSNSNQDSYISTSTKNRLQSIDTLSNNQPKQPEQNNDSIRKSWLAPDLPDLSISKNRLPNDDQDYIQPASFGGIPSKPINLPNRRLQFHRQQNKDQLHNHSSSTSPNRIIFTRPSRPGHTSKRSSSRDPLSPPLSTNSGPERSRSPVSPLVPANDQGPISIDTYILNMEKSTDLPTHSPTTSTPNSAAFEKFMPHRPPPPTSRRAKAYSSLAPAAAAKIAAQDGYSSDEIEKVSSIEQDDSISYLDDSTNGNDLHEEIEIDESSANHWRSKNHKKFTGGSRGSRFRKSRWFNPAVSDNLPLSNVTNPREYTVSDLPRPPSSDGRSSSIQVVNDEDYFGATQHDDPRHPRLSNVSPGEEALLKFLKRTLGPRSQNIAVRLMNKTPIKSTSSFSYSLHQGTEESDLEIMRRDLTSGRLYANGARLIGGAWCNLLLGDRFQPGSSKKQRHELTYRRTVCSCLQCCIQATDVARQQAAQRRDAAGLPIGDITSISDDTSTNMSTEVLSTMSSMTRTPLHSAMANFVVKQRIPTLKELMAIGASASSKELEIGTVVRLNYRASAKLKFTPDVSELFQHVAYTGPITHEEVYRQVTTRGVHYYLYNKGKKERKVYLQGHLVRLPIPVGVIKLGTQPMHMSELGSTFLLYRKQIMSIYIGQIVLEGNSLGSFIKTGIEYFIGFGEERGVSAVYPNKTLGKARKLGINELLLHHHMVSDLEVKCI